MHLTLSPVGTRKAAHARSVSQPCHHSHPVLARLDGGVRALRSWSASASGSGMADGSESGLALVEAVLAVLGELLELPHAAVALHDSAACDQILDGFLVLADSYGTFESALLELKQSVAELQAGVRRGDGATVAASLRAHRRTEKELCHLAAAMRHALRHTVVVSRPAAATDSEVADMVAEVAAAIAAASEAIFFGCAAMSPDVSAMVQTVPSNKWLARLGVAPAAKKAAPETAVAALERLEECIGVLESGSEKVFRSLLLLEFHSSTSGAELGLGPLGLWPEAQQQNHM